MSKVVKFPGATIPKPTDRHVSSAEGFYTAAEAARLTRVPISLVHAWRREGIIIPTIEAIDFDGRQQTGYTFESLVYLRLLRMLRQEGIPLFGAVMAITHLRDRFGSPGARWHMARIFVQSGDVFVERSDDWRITVATRHGQKAAVVLFGEDFRRLRERADALLIPADLQPFVEIDPEIRSGLPVVRDTAIQTGVIYRLHQNGQSDQSICEAYPYLALSQIRGAIAYETFLDAVAE